MLSTNCFCTQTYVCLRLFVFSTRVTYCKKIIMVKMLPKLPRCIANKRACLWINCLAKLSFIYACLAHLHPVVRNASRPKQYDSHFADLNLTSLTFPLPMKEVPRFEKQNPTIAVNIIGYSKTHFIPLYRSKNIVKENVKPTTLTLLFVNKHFYLVRNVSRLLGKNGVASSHYCFHCMCSIRCTRKFKYHQSLCSA